MRPGLDRPDRPDQLLEVLLALHEVDVAGVDHQERRLVVPMEEVVVRPRQLRQVLRVELPCELPAALADAGQQDVLAGLQVDDEVRLHHPRAEVLVDALVEGELVRVQRDGGEDAVFREQVVADRHLREQILLEELLLLAEPAEQEEELRLEGVLAAVLVEARQKRILFHHLENAAGVEALRERLDQRGLSDADRSLHRDVPVPELHAVDEINTDSHPVAALTFFGRSDLRGQPFARILRAWRRTGSTTRTPARSSPSAASLPSRTS